MIARRRTAGRRRLIAIEPRERAALGWSFAYFFCLLSGYYILRPLRDEMGIAGGVEQLPWVFSATFAAMLLAVPAFGWLTARYPRRRFLPAVYWFFAANLLAFFALLKAGVAPPLTARAFFVWVSVYNLFVVSVFWSFMVDLYRNAQARRLFGMIAAGGSSGALAGPAFTALAVGVLGPVNLLPLSAALLAAAVLCIQRLNRWAERERVAATTRGQPLGGGVWNGVTQVARSPYLLGIGLFMVLFTTTSTLLYFEQAHIVRAAYNDPAERTALFAAMDLAVNALTLLTQTLLTAPIVRALGLAATLALLPLATAAGFAALALFPSLGVLVVFQVLRRAGDYALARPARELLYTVLAPEAKYKAKNFIDTVVYRAGDAASSWLFAGLAALGLGLAGIAWVAVPVAGVWVATGWLLGRKQERLARRERR